MSLMFSLTAKLLGHQSSICEHNPPQECETQIASSAAVMGTLYVNLDQNQNMKLDLTFFGKLVFSGLNIWLAMMECMFKQGHVIQSRYFVIYRQT